MESHFRTVPCSSFGFLFATSFGSATRVKIPRLRSPGCLVTRQPGGRKRGILPSPVDVPPGRYKSNSIPAELGKTNTTVVINYTPNRANARLFSVNELQETEEVERDFFELRRSSFQKPLETLGLAKCYYLSNGFRRGLQTRILERNATVYRTLLCTTLTSTRDNPQLVLYLHAVARKCGGYKDFGSPVFLTYQGAQGGYRAASSLLRRIAHVAAMSQPGDDGVSNKLAVDGIKDGTYVGNLTILSITTGADGRQRAMFTSHVNGWNLGTTLEDDLVASAEANYIPGCFKLKTVAITICPTDVGDLLMKGYGEEQMLYRVDSTQNSSPLLDDGPNNGSS
ncbi:hypothetical protein FOL46_009895 [Perkinsus olseni]|uniref:Uncharacterized protein n=1 Tax=Perkinsus olseni TaxID=32597 RepID=A0A7J6KZ08_PEROL|nr:hypothetical protein FOL46_009895 [Perkinsus olseni]